MNLLKYWTHSQVIISEVEITKSFDYFFHFSSESGTVGTVSKNAATLIILVV